MSLIAGSALAASVTDWVTCSSPTRWQRESAADTACETAGPQDVENSSDTMVLASNAVAGCGSESTGGLQFDRGCCVVGSWKPAQRALLGTRPTA